MQVGTTRESNERMFRVVTQLACLLALLSCACDGVRPSAPTAIPKTQLARASARAEDLPAHGVGWRAAQRLLERRCVVCHGCYDAPCQLQLGTFEGIARGASKLEVYDGARLLAAAPTRLYVDAQHADEWRMKGFHPVLPEATRPDVAKSLLVRMLELKRDVPLPVSERLPDDLQVGLDRLQQCPRADEFERFAAEHPTWGMPYALPGLSPSEHALLVDWVAQGAPHDAEPPVDSGTQAAIERWERFLNQPSKKARLMARYVYEHLFLASLRFDEAPSGRYFRLVRARNPIGEPVEEIATRRPFEDPGPWPFYYRIVPRHGPVLDKTHMPYVLNEARRERYRALFLQPEYVVRELPSYDLKTAANPFAAFAAIPVSSRYRFLLDEAQLTIGGFIKGPVCRGQVALNVIDDRFWITFVDPESPVVAGEAALLARTQVDLGLPAEQGSNGLLVHWHRYARRQRAFLKAKSDYLTSLATTSDTVTLEHLWNGDGDNPNAALTVFRHFDSGSVVQGLVGGRPKTAWVLGYALLERIHYLLVAGFDVFGNIGHQLHTRMYMDFLRMEAEHNFLLMLPKARRGAVVDGWYRDASPRVKQHVYGRLARFDQESGLRFVSDIPEQEIFAQLQAHLSKVDMQKYQVEVEKDEELRSVLLQLAEVSGLAASLLAETSLLEVTGEGNTSRYFSLLRESAHTNVAQLFGEPSRRRPGEDRLTVVRGFVGAYPNVLFRVQRKQLPAFVREVAALATEQGYSTLRARYSIRRTHPEFWAHSDRIQDAHARLEPLSSGLLDYNRLDDR